MRPSLYSRRAGPPRGRTASRLTLRLLLLPITCRLVAANAVGPSPLVPHVALAPPRTPVERIFYLLLYSWTLAAAMAAWSQRADEPDLLELVGARQANAQSPESYPTTSGYTPAAYPAAREYSAAPSYPVANGTAFYPASAAPPAAVSRPGGWPGAVSSAPLAASTSHLSRGVSISSSQLLQPEGRGAWAPPAMHLPGGFSAADADLALPQFAELQGSKVIARVGTEDILAADVLGPVNDMLARNADKIPADQWEQTRMQLVQRAMIQLVQTKMILNHVRGKIPAEGYKKFEEKVGEGFDKTELPKLLERAGANTPAQLDDKLRSMGSSLERERQAFIEHTIAMSWVHEQCKVDKEITYEQMLDYYQKNAPKYDVQAKARWEQLMVRFDKYPSKAEAWRALAEAGNRVLAGASLAEQARLMSDGPTAKEGGAHDWTTQGSLASEITDRALFSLPVGQLSPILEDARCFRIVRVLERTDAGRRPFTDVQPEIKKLVKQDRVNAEIQKYVNKLQESTKVWTIFDPPADGQPAAAPSGPASFPALNPGPAQAPRPPAYR